MTDTNPSQRSELIVVVTDSPSAERALVDVLKKEHYRVLLSSLLEEALDLVTIAEPALLITDLHMKAIHGAAWIRAVRSLQPELPILVLTTFAGPADTEFARRLGATDCISKPYDIDSLRAIVRECVRKPASQDLPTE